MEEVVPLQFTNLPPGTILQYMHIRSRLGKILKKSTKNESLKFLELGSGNGLISNILLNLGYEGKGFDLSPEACKINAENNHFYVKTNKYNI